MLFNIVSSFLKCIHLGTNQIFGHFRKSYNSNLLNSVALLGIKKKNKEKNEN